MPSDRTEKINYDIKITRYELIELALNGSKTSETKSRKADML